MDIRHMDGELASRFGTWRVTSFINRFAFGARPDGRGGYWTDTPIGRFHLADYANFALFAATWERPTKSEVMNLKGRLFVDVGANVGYYSILAAGRGSHVVAIEPHDRAFDCLLDNITLNELGDKIEPHHYAAWSEARDVHFMPGRHSDTGKVHDVGPLVQAMPLDVILDGRIPTLIKIDTEGAEAQILKGMPDTLASHPRIIFEALSQSALKSCYPYLADYHIERLDRTNYLAT